MYIISSTCTHSFISCVYLRIHVVMLLHFRGCGWMRYVPKSIQMVCVYTYVKNRLFFHRIHILIGALVYLKALNMICEAEEKSFIKITESAHGWDVVFYIFNFFRGYYAFYPDCPNWYWVVLLESLFQIMW